MRSETGKATLTSPEEKILREQTGVTRPRLALRSGTKVDTGGWFLSSRLWLFITDQQIVLIAAAKRRYFQAIDLGQCADSFYSHATGQLVLEPIQDVPFKHIKLTPTEANGVLDLIQQGPKAPDTNPQSTTNTTASENSRA